MDFLLKILLIVIYLIIFMVKDTATQEQCQCPTVSPMDCLGYDSKLQANTLEEAITHFPDLSLDDAEGEDPSDVGCLTKKCQDCREDMRKQLQKIGLLDPEVNSIVASQSDANSTCTKYRFSQDKNSGGHGNEEADDEDDDDSSSEEKDKEKKKKKEKKEKDHHREKRQSALLDPNNSTVIGTRFTISCTTKGVTVDPTGTVSLCSSCWVWRKLPANYYPQYINELVCDTVDHECLSGYATCNVGTRTFEAVRTDNGVQTRVTLSAGSYCECRISSSSSLQSLVAGAGISGTFNPQHNSTVG